MLILPQFELGWIREAAQIGGNGRESRRTPTTSWVTGDEKKREKFAGCHARGTRFIVLFSQLINAWLGSGAGINFIDV
jgi:hypothetical protein